MSFMKSKISNLKFVYPYQILHYSYPQENIFFLYKRKYLLLAFRFSRHNLDFRSLGFIIRNYMLWKLKPYWISFSIVRIRLRFILFVFIRFLFYFSIKNDLILFMEVWKLVFHIIDFSTFLVNLTYSEFSYLFR